MTKEERRPELTVALVQEAQIWEEIGANLALFARRVATIAPGTDLIVLPEMFTTGFSMRSAALAEPMDGSGVDWMRATARKTGAAIVGSLIIRDTNRITNRLIWANPDGRLKIYDKRHLFRMAGEHQAYSPGNRLLTITCGGWRVRPFVCYDLRFPGWMRNTGIGYDIALVVANWPAARRHHWRRLLQARAIENLAYVLGVNRVGTDGNGQTFSGDSAVIGPDGSLLCEASEAPCILTHRLSWSALAAYREAFPAWKDADPELVGLFPEDR